MGGRYGRGGWGVVVPLVELKNTQIVIPCFLGIVIPYSIFSGIEETNLDGFPARAFFEFIDFRFGIRKAIPQSSFVFFLILLEKFVGYRVKSNVFGGP